MANVVTPQRQSSSIRRRDQRAFTLGAAVNAGGACNSDSNCRTLSSSSFHCAEQQGPPSSVVAADHNKAMCSDKQQLLLNERPP